MYAIGAQETNINRFLSHDPYQLHLFDSSTLQLFGQMLQTKLYPWLGFYLEMEMFLRTQDLAKSLLLYCWLHLSPKFHIKLTYLKSHLLEPSSFLFIYDLFSAGSFKIPQQQIRQLCPFCILVSKHWIFIGLDDLHN